MECERTLTVKLTVSAEAGNMNGDNDDSNGENILPLQYPPQRSLRGGEEGVGARLAVEGEQQALLHEHGG